MFIDATEQQLENFHPEFTIIHVPDFKASPELDGTRSETFILMDISQKLVLIGGTHYAGEIKKSIFTALNYLMPLQGIMSMHCSANIGLEGDTSLFLVYLELEKPHYLQIPKERLLVMMNTVGQMQEPSIMKVVVMPK